MNDIGGGIMDKDLMKRWNLDSIPSGAITGLIQDWSRGDAEAASDLFSSVYDALKERAAHYLRRESARQTMQTSELVNEVYLRLQNEKQLHFPSRDAFFAFAARMMRFILVERARSRGRQKRGDGEQAATYDPVKMAEGQMSLEPDLLLAVNDGLLALSKQDPRLALIVEMRFFAGMNHREIAGILELSERTVGREWTMAKRWLTRHLGQVGGFS